MKGAFSPQSSRIVISLNIANIAVIDAEQKA